MNINEEYLEQAKLILQCIPIIFEHNVFALKGGTALNFFYRDLPRLSVDIDLTYLKINDRKNAIAEIISELNYLQKRINKISGMKAQYIKKKNNPVGKLVAISKKGRIKIEPNLIIRGNVLATKNVYLSKEAQKIFELNVEAKCIDEKEIIASKIVAALDRQHPRDLFDIINLVDKNEVPADTINLFIIYALQSSRPLNEIVNPNLKELSQVYKNHFEGMTFEKASLEKLKEVRRRLIEILKKSMANNYNDFFISFYELNPKWELIPFDNIENFPGIKWKINNLKQISKAKREKELNDLINCIKSS